MTTSVALPTDLTPEDVKEGMRLNRTYKYWVRLLLANWYFTLMLVIIIWADILRIIDRKPLQAASVAVILIPLFFLWFSWYRSTAAIKKAANQLSDPQGSASADASGIHAKASSGATTFVPWRDYTAWKEGTDVFTLSTANSFRILTKRGVSQSDQQQLRSFFQTQIG